MRRLAAVVVLAAALTSCLELEETVTIRADGSGVQKMKLGVTDRALQAAARQAAIAPEGAAEKSDPVRIFDASLVREEVTTAGMECKKVKTFTERRRRFIEVEAEFASLEKLRASPLAGGEAEWEFFQGKRPGTVFAAFYPRGKVAYRVAQEKARLLTSKPSEREQQYFQRTVSQMKGLKLKWVLNLPGDVLALSKNTAKTGDRQITATVSEEDITSPKELILLLAPRFEVVFDGSACTFPLDE